MLFHATNLITEAFDRHGIKYHVDEREDVSIVLAGFAIRMGPQIDVRFISNDDDNDVAVRVFGLVCKVPGNRRAAVMEACNTLNRKIRFVKFYLDPENSVNMEVDLPIAVNDDCVGECCFELFARIMSILDDEFHTLGEALYLGADEKEQENEPLLQLLGLLKEHPIQVDDEQDLVADEPDLVADEPDLVENM